MASNPNLVNSYPSSSQVVLIRFIYNAF